MVESSSPTNSVCKMAIGIGAASLISLNLMPDPMPEVYYDSYAYSYECTSKNQCFYQLKHETMQYLLNQNEMEPIIDVPVVKTMKVRFNNPKRLEFYSIEDEKGFLG